MLPEDPRKERPNDQPLLASSLSDRFRNVNGTFMRSNARTSGVVEIPLISSFALFLMTCQVVVMQNIFYQRNISLVFDLKGSTRSRYVRPEGQDGNARFVL